MAEPRVAESHEGEPVSPELRPLLLAVYAALEVRPSDQGRLHLALDALLRFLASPAGRTDANCSATSFFFLLREGWAFEVWEVPEAYAAILADMAGTLHDAISAPAVAENFGSTPELLLGRLQRVPERAS